MIDEVSDNFLEDFDVAGFWIMLDGVDGMHSTYPGTVSKMIST